MIVARLLHEDTLELTDRVAGCLVLLYAQPLSRITIITRDQIPRHDNGSLTLRFGTDPATIPEPLAGLIRNLLDTGRPYTGIGCPADTPWLFPGLNPGQPLSAARLGVRLAKVGIDRSAPRKRVHSMREAMRGAHASQDPDDRPKGAETARNTRNDFARTTSLEVVGGLARCFERA